MKAVVGGCVAINLEYIQMPSMFKYKLKYVTTINKELQYGVIKREDF